MGFFGDDNGSFYAVDVHTGVPVWQDTYAGKIDSSPAVDSGVVFFGTEAGSVVAVDEHTGSAIWSMSTGGAVESSPAVSGGVVYVGSDDGTLYALRETDGTILWHVPLGGGPIHSSPAIDSIAGIVVVGDDSGFVTALDATAGTILWSYQTGGAVTATPMVTGGNVFVGSQDGSEYDLSEGTKNVNGLVVWKYATNGPIVSNTASVPKRVVFGSEDGTLYYLDSSKGVLTSSLATGSAIMGIAGSPRIVVATLQDGVAIGNRIGGTETTWKDVGDGVGFTSSPVINDGAVYITGLDDNLHVFDAPGHLIY
jgi:outer membrane protein assembly factor BamB